MIASLTARTFEHAIRSSEVELLYPLLCAITIRPFVQQKGHRFPIYMATECEFHMMPRNKLGSFTLQGPGWPRVLLSTLSHIRSDNSTLRSSPFLTPRTNTACNGVRSVHLVDTTGGTLFRLSILAIAQKARSHFFHFLSSV